MDTNLYKSDINYPDANGSTIDEGEVFYPILSTLYRIILNPQPLPTFRIPKFVTMVRIYNKDVSDFAYVHDIIVRWNTSTSFTTIIADSTIYSQDVTPLIRLIR